MDGCTFDVTHVIMLGRINKYYCTYDEYCKFIEHICLQREKYPE